MQREYNSVLNAMYVTAVVSVLRPLGKTVRHTNQTETQVCAFCRMHIYISSLSFGHLSAIM